MNADTSSEEDHAPTAIVEEKEAAKKKKGKAKKRKPLKAMESYLVKTHPFAVARRDRIMRFKSLLRFWTYGMEKYDLSMVLTVELPRLKDEWVPFWIFCASRGFPNRLEQDLFSDAPSVQFRRKNLCSTINLRVIGTTQQDLLLLVEDELRKMTADKPLKAKHIRKGLERIYCDPVACAMLVQHRIPFPTEEGLKVTLDAINTAADAYREKFWHRAASCKYVVRIPPLRSERALAFQTRLEYTIDPSILDHQCTLTRYQDDLQDPLFDKMVLYVPDDAIRKKGGKLIFDYGSLIDVGQVFTYGEKAELSARLVVGPPEE
jgi:hypothetical protein